MKKRRLIFPIGLILLLVGSNVCWYKVYSRERSKIKNAIVPTLSEDYFTRQLALTKMQMENKENRGNDEFESTSESFGEVFDYSSVFSKKEVPFILQNPKYPNGCESASAVMLLNYFGIAITLEEFITNYLPTEEVYEQNGERFGPDPAKFYAGNPESETRGWGAFEPVIADTIKSVVRAKTSGHYELLTSDYNKMPLSYLVTEEKPFLIWVTIGYEEATEVYEWFNYNKKNTYSYPKNAHVVVLTGSDESFYYINDPLVGKDRKVEKEKLEKSYDSMGRQFIGLSFYTEIVFPTQQKE